MSEMKAGGLIPHLVVKDGAKAIEFYKAALGAEEIARMPTPEGRVMHAALKISGAYLFLCDDFPEHCGGGSRAPNGPSPVTLHLNVPMAHAALALALFQLPFLWNLFWSIRHGREAGVNPWDSTTIEWSAPTPPPHGNFPNPVRAYRDPYDYSVPGAAADFTPQALARQDVTA